MHDIYWKKLILNPGKFAPWLRDHGSLTRRIQQRCDVFTVLPQRSGLARIAFDESRLLALPDDRFAFSREVFLCADGRPVVFAHSTCAHADLSGVWQAMGGLGNRSLGSLLFTHPLVVRQPLHYKTLRPNHPLYKSATTKLETKPGALWARRSLFYLHQAPLLVTEVFLPDILKLNSKSQSR